MNEEYPGQRDLIRKTLRGDLSEVALRTAVEEVWQSMKGKWIFPEAIRVITSGHWSNGGTGVTNFRNDDDQLYKKAIEIYGDKRLVVSPMDLDHKRMIPDYSSLHYLGEERGDLSIFWHVFDKLQRGEPI